MITQPKQRRKGRSQLEATAAASGHDHDNVIATPEELAADVAQQGSLRVADREPGVLRAEERIRVNEYPVSRQSLR